MPMEEDRHALEGELDHYLELMEASEKVGALLEELCPDVELRPVVAALAATPAHRRQRLLDNLDLLRLDQRLRKG